MQHEKKVDLDLSADEALVLFEWLSRFNHSEGGTFEDAAEQRVLFDLESKLESILVAPLKPDYKKLLADARYRVRGAE